MAILDHVTFLVSDLARSKAFYLAALEPLGYGVAMEFPGFLGLGPPGKPAFWLRQAESVQPTHIAFGARSRKDVDAFHAAALEAGGKDNGAPGTRKEYHPNYYGAFVLDPDGHNVEAVIHTPA